MVTKFVQWRMTTGDFTKARSSGCSRKVFLKEEHRSWNSDDVGMDTCCAKKSMSGLKEQQVPLLQGTDVKNKRPEQREGKSSVRGAEGRSPLHIPHFSSWDQTACFWVVCQGEKLVKETINVTTICFKKAHNWTQFLQGMVKSCSVSNCHLSSLACILQSKFMACIFMFKKKNTKKVSTLNKIGIYFSFV